ncbi:MAG: ATP-binding protein [Gaiellaceae bacterium]|jgi:signal transduction histidine kinase
MNANQPPDEQLIRSGRMVAIGRLTPALIHELNNSLLVLLGTADLELAMLPPGSKERERMESVRDAGVEIRDAVSQLAAFTRAPLEGEQRLSLVEVARSVAALSRRLRLQREVGFEDSYCEDELYVQGNEAELAQALLHMLTNAFQASGTGDAVTLELKREKDWAVALVGDPGAGVPPEQAEQIFELFETTMLDQQGSGLGLTAARVIARRHGGELELRPSPEGAVFALRLPLSN